VRALMIGVQDGVFAFDEVFSAYMVWGDGRTTYESLLPVTQAAASKGRQLPALSDLAPPLLEVTR